MGAEVLRRIEVVLGRYIADPAQVAKIMSGASFQEQAAIDSVTLLNIMLDLEKEFEVAFDADAFERGGGDVTALAAFCSGSD